MKLGDDTAGTADPNWQKGYFIPYDVMLSIQAGGVGPGAAIAAQGWSGYHSSGGEQLHCASLVLFIIISSFAFLLNCLYVSP